MIKVLILEKEHIKEENIDIFENLYKKCKFKKVEDFIEIKKWNYNDLTIKLFGKNKGKTTSKVCLKIKNEEILIYGNSALIAIKDNNFVNLNKELWNKFLASEVKENNEISQCNENAEDIILNKNNQDNDYEEEELDKESEEGEKENQEKDEIENKDEEQDDLEEHDEEDEEFEDSEEEDIINKNKNEDKINFDIADDENNFSGSELAEEQYIYTSEEGDD